MASLKLEHIYKVYPNGHKAVTDFNMEIKDGEFIVFVGPSGCGKSTTLRMIAGLEEISSGELYIGDTIVNDMQPKDRDIAMVFQNYALYPHMTVYENMAFGLTLRKVPRTEIHEKVMWAADALGLKEYLDRKPKAMSGGQRQRVSLGRAILRNPKVMLLDEPLSNLDAKLRSQMRSVIGKLHQQLKTTFIYVTHDQVEAMTLGTRVVVMKLGKVQQIDTPQNLYDHPINKFVAGFIGTPQMNFFNVTLKEGAKDVDVAWSDVETQPHLKLSKDQVLKAEKKFLQGTKQVVLGFRCEAISVEEEDLAKGDNIVDVIISHFEELGNETLIYGDLKQIEGLGEESKTPVIIKATSKKGFKPGDRIKARIDINKIHLFDAETEMTILPPVPEYSVLPVDIIDGNLKLFGTERKPNDIPVDFVEGGTISLPLSAIKVGEGNVSATINLIEVHGDKYLAQVKAGDHKLFCLVSKDAKVGDKIKFAVDYSQATFRDKDEKIIGYPLAERDDLKATFVNLKTAFEVTQNQAFMDLQAERVKAVEDKYASLEAQFSADREKALKEAEEKEKANASKVGEEQAKLNETNNQIKKDIAESKKTHSAEVKEIKARHKSIHKEELSKIEEMYKKMWENEKKDYKKSMETNKDPESRRSRRMSYQIFKESFPQMKQNDIERKENALDFDKETELGAADSKFSQKMHVLKEELVQNKVKFEAENYPVKGVNKEYEEKAKELANKKKDELLKAQLIFFFKFDEHYELLPDDITTKIIQGLGNKVFTKVFRVAMPHDGFVEDKEGLAFQVIQEVNFGDVKMYKCAGELYGEKVYVYIRKEREIERGETLHLKPVIEKSEIYESELNIRLY